MKIIHLLKLLPKTANPSVVQVCHYGQSDSLINAANDSTWFGYSALRSWLDFKYVKQYSPVIILPILNSAISSGSIRMEKTKSNFIAYPNPSADYATLTLKNPEDQIREV